jgi:hypothetical protein
MAWEDNVRPYQLPQNTLAQTVLNAFNLATNEPVIVKPGFGGTSSGQLPPLQVSGGSASLTITSYMDMSAVELATSAG